jgi:hypothetical protein
VRFWERATGSVSGEQKLSLQLRNPQTDQTIKCRNNFRSWPVAEMTATPVAAGFSGRAVASRRSLRITFSHSFEGLRRQNNDFAAFDANPPVLLPGLQFPVDGFASHTNETPEILLGD